MEQIDFPFLKELADKYGTPYYLMFPDIYKTNVQKFLSAFKRRYDKVLLGYSFKTNYVPSLCKLAQSLGCYAEVVSEMEYSLAKELGFKNIIFNGPIKPQGILIQALKDSSIVNLDSMYEVDYVCDYKKQNPQLEINVGLRINIELVDENGCSKIQNGLRKGRFGFSKQDLQEVVRRLRDLNIHIISIHGHTSSSDRAVVNYKIIVQQMLDVCMTYGLMDVQYFDVGGGFFGAAAKGIDVSNKPTYEDYANLICDIVCENAWFKTVAPKLVLEPGVSVVANVFSYVSKIYQKKNISDKTFVTTDGSVFDVKPTMHNNNLPFQIVSSRSSFNTLTCDIVGSTCMEKDVILKDVVVPDSISKDDFLFISGVGAYTIVMTPTFINYLSPIISVGQNTKVVRRRQQLKDILNMYEL